MDFCILIGATRNRGNELTDEGRIENAAEDDAADRSSSADARRCIMVLIMLVRFVIYVWNMVEEVDLTSSTTTQHKR